MPRYQNSHNANERRSFHPVPERPSWVQHHQRRQQNQVPFGPETMLPTGRQNVGYANIYNNLSHDQAYAPARPANFGPPAQYANPGPPAYGDSFPHPNYGATYDVYGPPGNTGPGQGVSGPRDFAAPLADLGNPPFPTTYNVYAQPNMPGPRAFSVSIAPADTAWFYSDEPHHPIQPPPGITVPQGTYGMTVGSMFSPGPGFAAPSGFYGAQARPDTAVPSGHVSNLSGSTVYTPTAGSAVLSGLRGTPGQTPMYHAGLETHAENSDMALVRFNPAAAARASGGRPDAAYGSSNIGIVPTNSNGPAHVPGGQPGAAYGNSNISTVPINSDGPAQVSGSRYAGTAPVPDSSQMAVVPYDPSAQALVPATQPVTASVPAPSRMASIPSGVNNSAAHLAPINGYDSGSSIVLPTNPPNSPGSGIGSLPDGEPDPRDWNISPGGTWRMPPPSSVPDLFGPANNGSHNDFSDRPGNGNGNNSSAHHQASPSPTPLATNEASMPGAGIDAADHFTYRQCKVFASIYEPLPVNVNDGPGPDVGAVFGGRNMYGRARSEYSPESFIGANVNAKEASFDSAVGLGASFPGGASSVLNSRETSTEPDMGMGMGRTETRQNSFTSGSGLGISKPNLGTSFISSGRGNDIDSALGSFGLRRSGYQMSGEEGNNVDAETVIRRYEEARGDEKGFYPRYANAMGHPTQGIVVFKNPWDEVEKAKKAKAKSSATESTTSHSQRTNYEGPVGLTGNTIAAAGGPVGRNSIANVRRGFKEKVLTPLVTKLKAPSHNAQDTPMPPSTPRPEQGGFNAAAEKPKTEGRDVLPKGPLKAHTPHYAHCACCDEILWDLGQMMALHCCKTGVHVSCYCLALDCNKGGEFKCPVCGKKAVASYGADEILEFAGGN